MTRVFIDQDNDNQYDTNETSKAFYTYDSFGRRISKTVGSKTTTYVYDGPHVIAEYENDILARTFIYGPGIDAPAAMIDLTGGNPVVYFYYYDGLGSVAALSNNGQIAERYRYDAFGNTRIFNGSGAEITDPAGFLGNPYMFTGRRLDPETRSAAFSGLYYYRARMYNPQLARFMQTDPIGYYDSMNLYQYCLNNPVNYIDPSGLAIKEAKKRKVYNAIHTTLDAIGILGDAIPGVGNLVAALSDLANAGVYAFQGDLGNAAMSLAAVAPYAGTAAKYTVAGGMFFVAKYADEAGRYSDEVIEGIVHGNSKLSKKFQHGYEIYNKETGDVMKTGISGSPLNKNGTSPRANRQVNKLNKIEGGDIYGPRVVEENIPGRQNALDWEIENANRLWREGNSLEKHKYPRQWEK